MQETTKAPPGSSGTAPTRDSTREEKPRHRWWDPGQVYNSLHFALMQKRDAYASHMYITHPQTRDEFLQVLQLSATAPDIQNGAQILHSWLRQQEQESALPFSFEHIWSALLTTLKSNLNKRKLESQINATSAKQANNATKEQPQPPPPITSGPLAASAARERFRGNRDIYYTGNYPRIETIGPISSQPPKASPRANSSSPSSQNLQSVQPPHRASQPTGQYPRIGSSGAGGYQPAPPTFRQDPPTYRQEAPPSQHPNAPNPYATIHPNAPNPYATIHPNMPNPHATIQPNAPIHPSALYAANNPLYPSSPPTGQYPRIGSSHPTQPPNYPPSHNPPNQALPYMSGTFPHMGHPTMPQSSVSMPTSHPTGQYPRIGSAYAPQQPQVSPHPTNPPGYMQPQPHTSPSIYGQAPPSSQPHPQDPTGSRWHGPSHSHQPQQQPHPHTQHIPPISPQPQPTQSSWLDATRHAPAPPEPPPIIAPTQSVYQPQRVLLTFLSLSNPSPHWNGDLLFQMFSSHFLQKEHSSEINAYFKHPEHSQLLRQALREAAQIHNPQQALRELYDWFIYATYPLRPQLPVLTLWNKLQALLLESIPTGIKPLPVNKAPQPQPSYSQTTQNTQNTQISQTPQDLYAGFSSEDKLATRLLKRPDWNPLDDMDVEIHEK